MMRHVTAAALCMCMLLAPSQSHAQLHEVVKACKQSVRNYLICLVAEEGIERAIEVGYSALADFATGKSQKLEGNVVELPKKEKDGIESDGIAWPDLKAYLNSIFGSKEPVDDAQARAIIHASCQTKFSPICAYLGVANPADRVADCSVNLTQSDCETKMLCSWNGSACVRSSAGTKELLKNLPKN